MTYFKMIEGYRSIRLYLPMGSEFNKLSEFRQLFIAHVH